MQQYTNTSLNVYRLLTLKDLDIRGLAGRNPTLTAEEYFSKIERFLEDAPGMKEALLNFTGLVEDGDISSELGKIKNTLTEIGCDKLNADIDNIHEAIAGGQTLLAAGRMAEISEKFNFLYEKIKSARLLKRFNRMQTGNSSPDEKNGWILLKDAFKAWDNEEATRKLRILAVDDVTIVLNTLTSVLSKHYEVFALTSASEVEKFLNQNSPELFLLDIEMPDMSGYDLIHVIRRFEEHKDTPIIILTGNASAENVKTAISLGACDFITKPINPNILLEKIGNKIIRKKTF